MSSPQTMVTVGVNVENTVMGIALAYQSTKGGLTYTTMWAGFPYYSISLSLNILLTLMIVVRLILYARTTRTVLGGAGIGGLCKTIITMLIESCVLYAVSSLLVIGPWSASDDITNVFLPILDQTQVRVSMVAIFGHIIYHDDGECRLLLRCSSFNESPTGAR